MSKQHFPGRLWIFKDDAQGKEVGKFGEYKEDNEVYIDGYHWDRLKNVYTKRQKHKWDNWVIYTGDEGDGKSMISKQDCYSMSYLCDGKFDINQVAWDPDYFGKLIDESNHGDSVLYDEGITGLDAQRTMSEVNHILKVKSTMCRRKRLFVAICIPSLFDLQKPIAIRRTFGMVKVYTDEVTRGFFRYYNRRDKRTLYIKGKKYEDMDAYPGAEPSRFLRWSFIDEKEYEKRKEISHKNIFKEKMVFNKYKEQRNALIRGMYDLDGMTQDKIMETMKQYSQYPLTRPAITEIISQYNKIPKE